MVKISPADAGHTGLIPGSGRSPGEGHGHPLQYSCLENPHGQGQELKFSKNPVKLVALVIKNPPAMQETRV